MIAKHVPMNSAQSSDFAGLVKYLTGPQGKDERVGLVCITNCQADQVEIAVLEILNTQAQNTRATADKTYHLIVSFRANETPDDATLRAIEERLSNGLGFNGHQRVSVVHHDTDNLHMHIAINKIHPVRRTIHEPFNAYHTLGQLCERLEKDYGLERDNHKADKVHSENRASDMEHNAAVESLLGWIKRECAEQMQQAQSWDGMHQVMREHGLTMHERANGLVITSENGISVKASSVHRSLSKSKLENRLGGFEPAQDQPQNIPPGKRYGKKPMRSSADTTELYARYKVDQQFAITGRAAEWSKAVARKKRLIEDAKRTGRLKRAAIKLLSAPRIAKKLMYAATSNSLRDEIAAINQQYIKERQEIYERYQRRAWADWLRREATAGDPQALAALRLRDPATGLEGNTVGGTTTAKGKTTSQSPDSITKNGTIIYRFGASAIRDDGEKLKVSRGADQAGLEAALRMAMKRFGGCITVNGSAAFKKRIVHAAVAANLSVRFSDDALESRRQQLDQSLKNKERKHGNFANNQGDTVRRRPDRSRHGNARQAEASRAARASTAGTESVQRGANGGKPHARSAGKTAPPQAHHGLRDLSELGVVHVTNRGEVLLPGHVPGHVEHKGSKPNHGVRRHIHRPGRVLSDNANVPIHSGDAVPAASARAVKPNVARTGSAPPPASKERLRHLSQLGTIMIGGASAGEQTTPHAIHSSINHDASPTPMPVKSVSDSPGQSAADKYIAEREAKRARGLAIPKHTRFESVAEEAARYVGSRQIEGQALALLAVGDEIMVLPIDDATALRLKRLVVGQQLVFTSKGAIKTKGRTR